MTLPRLFALSILVIGVCHAAPEASVEGMAEVRSRYLDKVYLRPQADFAAYRKVFVEAAPVRLRTEANINERFPARISPEDEREISAAAAGSVHESLVEAFKGRGYEISTDAGPGVLRLSPRVTELVINILGDGAATRTFTREAGQATLVLEARDPSGTLVAHIAHRGTAGQTGRLNLANQVTTRFWFEAFFARWAADCAEAVKTPASP